MSLFTHPIEYLHCNLMYSIKWCTITGTVKPSDNTKVCLCSAVTWHYPLPSTDRTGCSGWKDEVRSKDSGFGTSSAMSNIATSTLPPLSEISCVQVTTNKSVDYPNGWCFAVCHNSISAQIVFLYEIHSVIWTSEILAQITWPTKSRDLSNYVPYQITWPTSTTSRDLFQFPAAGESARKTKEVRVFPTKQISHGRIRWGSDIGRCIVLVWGLKSFLLKLSRNIGF